MPGAVVPDRSPAAVAEAWDDPLGRWADDPAPQDACGVVGVRDRGDDVARLAVLALATLQHRGQEAAGLAVGDGTTTLVYKELGLVSQVLDEATVANLAGHGHVAVAHTRYSTTGADTWANAQPSFHEGADGRTVALGHNGNLTNTAELARRLAELPGRARGHLFSSAGATTDSDVVTALLAAGRGPLARRALDVLPLLHGAFSLVMTDAETLLAARDPQGVRPLVLGRLRTAEHDDGSDVRGPGDGWVVASESPALDVLGARLVREVQPGELLVVDDDGIRGQRWAPAAPASCVFEYVYLSRPDSRLGGRGVHASRVEVGRVLAREAPAVADLVIPVPESGTPAAIGYAEASGIPYGQGLVKNSYVGRTFIQPTPALRARGIRLKLTPLRDVVEGRRLVVVDDSVVRGSTQRALVRMLREAGAAEVHVRVASPPVRWPCFYGIDFATRAELVAARYAVDEVAELVDADSLAHVSLEGLVEATRQPPDSFCDACFTGTYPIDVPDALGKDVLERPAAAAGVPGAGRQEVIAAGVPGAARQGLTGLPSDGADPSPDDVDGLADLPLPGWTAR